jgi:hypothetical protein
MLPFLGNRAVKSVYPGKKSTKGSPKIMRGTLDGEKTTMGMSKMVKMHITERSLCSLILKEHRQMPSPSLSHLLYHRHRRFDHSLMLRKFTIKCYSSYNCGAFPVADAGLKDDEAKADTAAELIYQ